VNKRLVGRLSIVCARLYTRSDDTLQLSHDAALKPDADDGFLSGEIENIVFTPTKIRGSPADGGQMFFVRGQLSKILNMFDQPKHCFGTKVFVILPADDGFLSKDKCSYTMEDTHLSEDAALIETHTV
jgi:hypothetical protein